MRCQASSNHQSRHFSVKRSSMADQQTKSDNEKSILTLLSHLSLSKLSLTGKHTSSKRSSPRPANVPKRQHARRGTDEGIGAQSSSKNFMNHKNHMMSDRSYSCPPHGHERPREDEVEPQPSLTPQLSIFQSPFDPPYETTKEEYRYDVNISCHKNQLVWVENFLLPILEKELGLNCYLYDRDHLAGVTSVKNIAAAVRESRLTILCFSKDYLCSSWQKYEALLAHHLDPGGWKKRILPIVVENCALPFKYTIYATLKWPQCENGDAVPASVKLRRRFFIFGLLNALGVQRKEMMLEIYQKYCALNTPVTAIPIERNCFV